MKRARFGEEQIINILKEAEGGAKVTGLCRRHGISEATFYTCGRWPRSGAGGAVLHKNAPDVRRPQSCGTIAAIPILGGLHHQYVRV